MSIKRFDRTRAYVKIEDGCENKCTYCIIGTARGKIRSKPLDEIVREVTCLAQNGCREVVLTGIETSAYGRDLNGAHLIDVLESVDGIPGVERIRLGSLDPTTLNENFVTRLAKLKHITPYFHISLQSGSNKILNRMKRPYNRQTVLDGVCRVKAAMPTTLFTADVITGFPGETTEDFNETVTICRQIGFIHIHAFPYSRREGTEADTMPDQIGEAVKKARVGKLAEVEKENRGVVFPSLIGKTVSVLFETYKDGQALGHTDNFAEVSASSARDLHGEFKSVRITDFDDDRLYGNILEE